MGRDVANIEYREDLGRRDRFGPFLQGFRSGIGLDTNPGTRPRSGLNILRILPRRASKLKRKMPGVWLRLLSWSWL